MENRYGFTTYLRLHLIQNWVIWGQMNGFVPLLNGLPVPKEYTQWDSNIFISCSLAATAELHTGEAELHVFGHRCTFMHV